MKVLGWTSEIARSKCENSPTLTRCQSDFLSDETPSHAHGVQYYALAQHSKHNMSSNDELLSRRTHSSHTLRSTRERIPTAPLMTGARSSKCFYAYQLRASTSASRLTVHSNHWSILWTVSQPTVGQTPMSPTSHCRCSSYRLAAHCQRCRAALHYPDPLNPLLCRPAH